MITLTGHQRRQASGTGAETAPEILEGPDGTRLGTPPPSLGRRVGGGIAGAVAGGAAGRVLRPVARKIAQRYGLPPGAVVRVTEIAAPMLLSAAMERLARHRARARTGTTAEDAKAELPPDEPPGPIKL
ncbi:hypothetical protein [Actinomadura rugatobispora]|uniref:Uncharacterized protein n=1 Tax=Actinomadura rugatobispora TaxID=1994 RepID=A0ABW1ADF7_9ACTN|nr:hypothetical protein GCM10010200_063820 [Actinomadura rugatobispora]